MLDVSYLYCGMETGSAPHRYGRAVRSDAVRGGVAMKVARSAQERRPIVVWNVTRTCNLRCVHCYTDSEGTRYEGELTGAECRAVLDDLAGYGVAVVLFSGGEPLVREDLFELAGYARGKGMGVVLSTNGTLIDGATAMRLKETGFSYVGISLDSARAEVHDAFRGVAGAFARTMAGFRQCVAAGQKVGLRLTLTKQTCGDIGGIFRFIGDEGIDRACFYHLCPSGRGAEVAAMAREETRAAVEEIFERTKALHERGRRVEILTVDQPCDGAALYLRMKRDGDRRAEEVLGMLRWNGGGRYSSGVGIANIDFGGNVHADQFSMHRTFGNVRERRFSEIWEDVSDPVMAGLKDRLGLLKGRCGRCCFKEVCGGGLRARAEKMTGDVWGEDPGCYLTEEEIAGVLGT